jgi:hypothetical protein
MNNLKVASLSLLDMPYPSRHFRSSSSAVAVVDPNTELSDEKAPLLAASTGPALPMEKRNTLSHWSRIPFGNLEATTRKETQECDWCTHGLKSVRLGFEGLRISGF